MTEKKAIAGIANLGSEKEKKGVDPEPEEAINSESTSPSSEDLIPKAPPKLAPRGLRAFTVFRKSDESGVSGDGVVIEGVELATGQSIVHWLYPPPRGGIAIFESMDDFIKVHIGPHPSNSTIITFQDGEQLKFGEGDSSEPKESHEKKHEIDA